MEFMLTMIRNALKEICETHGGEGVAINVTTNVGINVATNVVTNEDKVLSLLKQDSKMSSKMLAVSIGITQRQAQRILAKLKEDGRIIRYGAKKNGYWKVMEK